MRSVELEGRGTSVTIGARRRKGSISVNWRIRGGTIGGCQLDACIIAFWSFSLFRLQFHNRFLHYGYLWILLNGILLFFIAILYLLASLGKLALGATVAYAGWKEKITPCTKKPPSFIETRIIKHMWNFEASGGCQVSG
ncbi:uncharacterized protein LOC120276130 isoform X4 [Dioscorea cayenensis subsp. rotundata]|uniref:Uncharacterized protein LOC120276130 isoform X4 n=1 Tax=Dioscorea cayennensis subsp. rotundata TaxID=55577 RepID=A0AB40CJ78_DIOCR|nr:uncharacterized protein LOC120276130 isoform X4 [Dioscorea cayenensis subsp. rotundata]